MIRPVVMFLAIVTLLMACRYVGAGVVTYTLVGYALGATIRIRAKWLRGDQCNWRDL